MKAIRSVSSMLVGSRLTASVLIALTLRVCASFVAVVLFACLLAVIELIRPQSPVRSSRPSSAPAARDAIATQPALLQPPQPPDQYELPQPATRAPIQAASRRYGPRPRVAKAAWFARRG